MLARVRSAAVLGIDAYVVDVETDIVSGLPCFTTVGLPQGAVKEGKERVGSAVVNSEYSFPLKRITVNLAPADVRKDGSAFDLPIAIGILAATGQLNGGHPEEIVAEPSQDEQGSTNTSGVRPCDITALEEYLLVGELGLEGGVRPVRGALPVAIAAKHAGFKGGILPVQNMAEAGVVGGIEVLGAESLRQVGAFLGGEGELRRARVDPRTLFGKAQRDDVDLAEIRGQEHAKRALEVAAAGSHNLLMTGPPVIRWEEGTDRHAVVQASERQVSEEGLLAARTT